MPFTIVWTGLHPLDGGLYVKSHGLSPWNRPSLHVITAPNVRESVAKLSPVLIHQILLGRFRHGLSPWNRPSHHVMTAPNVRESVAKLYRLFIKVLQHVGIKGKCYSMCEILPNWMLYGCQYLWPSTISDDGNSSSYYKNCLLKDDRQRKSCPVAEPTSYAVSLLVFDEYRKTWGIADQLLIHSIWFTYYDFQTNGDRKHHHYSFSSSLIIR